MDLKETLPKLPGLTFLIQQLGIIPKWVTESLKKNIESVLDTYHAEVTIMPEMPTVDLRVHENINYQSIFKKNLLNLLDKFFHEEYFCLIIITTVPIVPNQSTISGMTLKNKNLIQISVANQDYLNFLSDNEIFNTMLLDFFFQMLGPAIGISCNNSCVLNKNYHDLSRSFKICSDCDDKFRHFIQSHFTGFEINEFLTLKLQHGVTYIYVKGEKFMQCIQLALQFPKEDAPQFEEIESIDDAAEIYNQYLHQNIFLVENNGQIHYSLQTDIPPEQEFWGHCSNLQAWIEHDYDTRILRSNLSFPLLKKLAEVGDPKARRAFKDELFKRLESRYVNVITYLLEQDYLQYLNKEELSTVFEHIPELLDFSFESHIIYYNLGNALERMERIDNAIQFYEKSKKLEPTFIKSWVKLIQIYMKREDYPMALYLINQYLAQVPGEIIMLEILSMLYSNMNDHYSAFSTMKQLISDDYKNEQIWRLYADISNYLRYHDEAIKAYRKILELNPGDKVVQDKLQQVLSRNS